MKTIIKISFLFVVAIVLTGCPIDKIGLSFNNNTERKVYVLDGIYGKNTDTTLSKIQFSYLFPVNPNRGYILGKNEPDEGKDSMAFFVFDADTINKYGWEKVKSEYRILQRYDLKVSYGELKKMNFEISFPPTEDMKDIHMYPPYGTYR